MKKILALLAALAISTAPQAATAFDQLERFAPVFSNSPQDPLAFTYVAPQDGFRADSPSLYGMEDHTLQQSLVDARDVDPTTGIAFPQVTGTLSTGQSPNQLTILFGQPGFLDATEATQTARGFTKSTEAGLAVLSKGDDYAMDFTAMSDPLGGGMGKSQRLALGDDFLMRSAGWPEMRAALAALEQPAPATALWTATIAGLRQASGESWLDAAIGWNAVSFLAIGDPAALTLAPDATTTKPAPTTALPAFPHAIIALTQDRDGAAVRIALPFASPDEAQKAGAIIADRLLAQLDTAMPQPSVAVEAAAPYFVAVITMEVAGESLAETTARFAAQNNAVMQRSYDVLQLP